MDNFSAKSLKIAKIFFCDKFFKIFAKILLKSQKGDERHLFLRIKAYITVIKYI